MIQRVLSHYHLPLLTCLGLLLFMGVFIGALLWVYRKESADVYQALADLPLELPVKKESSHV
ncbi:MAG: CcoQ/FixQ family Cbb3-type cytochrome c oxidase assembly chaperone [Bdellovibrionota bacterium]